jgi:hypothetical protein
MDQGRQHLLSEDTYRKSVPVKTTESRDYDIHWCAEAKTDSKCEKTQSSSLLLFF